MNENTVDFLEQIRYFSLTVVSTTVALCDSSYVIRSCTAGEILTIKRYSCIVLIPRYTECYMISSILYTETFNVSESHLIALL